MSKQISTEIVAEINTKPKYPGGFLSYLKQKIEKNGGGGRPHFLAEQAKDRDPAEVVLDILELAWLKNRSNGSIARKFGTKYHTIYRLLKDLEPFKTELIHILETVPRRKTFWNRKLNTSDYETVQAYIRHALRVELKKYKTMLNTAERVWRALHYKDPARWTADEVVAVVQKQSGKGGQAHFVDAVRCVAPQIADRTSPDYIGTGMYREKIARRKVKIFGAEVKLIHEALDANNMHYQKTIFDFHVTGAFREGTKNDESGICGISWDRFHKQFTLVDDYESKVRKMGIHWRDCPVDLFFPDLPERLRAIWRDRGKPRTGKVVERGYAGLRKVYQQIQKALMEYWQGKVDPDIMKEFSQLKPHSADKIHCNLLWEAEVPLEVVAGEHIGGQEAIGLVGRGWLSTDTIKKYYLSLTRRSKRYKDMMAKVTEYSKQFNGGVHEEA